MRKKALALVHRVDEVKKIRDQARGLAEYARQAKDTELIEYATEIRLRAERRAGEMLAKMQKASGGQVGGRKKKDGTRERPSIAPVTLADLKIDKNQSSRWQRLAALDSDSFEEKVEADHQARLQHDDTSPPKGREDQTGEGAARQGYRARLHRR
jgi:hypothetical protein